LKVDVVAVVRTANDVTESSTGEQQKVLKCFNASNYEGEQELTPGSGLTMMA